MSVALLIPAVAGLYISCRCLPPIQEMPPFELGREERNWIGQGGLAFAGYAVLLVMMAYCVKRIILTRCANRWAAVCFFSLFVTLSLPYISASSTEFVGEVWLGKIAKCVI